MKHYLTATLGSYKFHFEITSKLTKVIGDSGIGKTTLIKALNNRSTKIESSLELMPLPLKMPKKGAASYFDIASDENILFYGDEDLDYLLDEDFQKALTKTNSFFLIVKRDNFHHVPYGYLDMYTMNSVGRDYTLVKVYENLNNLKVDYSRVQRVCVEDEKSGYQFFKSFSPVPVLTAKGKDNVVNILKAQTNCLAVLDGVGCGATIKTLMEELNVHSTNQLLLIDSFEIMVLKSKFIGLWEDPPILCSNVEVYGSDLLTSIMMNLGQSYQKSTCSKCFTQDCCHTYIKCKLYTRDTKPQIIAGEIYDGLMSTQTPVSRTKSDREIAIEIVEDNSEEILQLASKFSSEFKANHKTINFNNALSIQMHCQMLLELNQI